MKEVLRLIVVLTGICLVCAALMGMVYVKTLGPIKDGAIRRRLEAAQRLLPSDAGLPETVGAGSVTGYVARSGSGIAGIVVEGRSSQGYNGDIVLMVGFTDDGRLLDYAVVQHQETPGLGSKIDKPFFHERIAGKPATTRWHVTKDGGEIDAITAATISSRAVLEAIRDATANFQAVRAAAAP